MKIAQVAPLFESVPPPGYGGTERIVSCLTEELIAQGHEVTLFATGDSRTRARLESPVSHALRNKRMQLAWLPYFAVQMDQVRKRARDFDIIHFHTEYLHFPLAESLGVPHVTTLHGRLDMPELVPLYRHFSSCPLISISDSQRAPLQWAHWLATVHHGLPDSMAGAAGAATAGADEKYFVFIGRISPEKRVDRAIEVASRCGTPLRIAAKIDDEDRAYFESRIRPLLDNPLVRFLGEVGDAEKYRLLGAARALLFPIDWPEPFGLVMIEAFSCGTPVIAYRNGSVPEIMEEGVTGFIVENQEQAVNAARGIDAIDRAACRAAYERRFTPACMAQRYLDAYRQVLEDPGLRMQPDAGSPAKAHSTLKSVVRPLSGHG